MRWHRLVLFTTSVLILSGLLVTTDNAFSALFVDSFAVPEDTSPQGLAFNPAGTKMFVVGNTDDRIEEYDCAAFDVSTCVVVAGGSFAAGDGEPSDIAFNPAGTKMFILGNGANTVIEYDCTAFDVSTCVVDGGAAFNIAGQELAATGLAFSPAGTKMFVVGDTGNDVNEYDCTAFDVSTCVVDAGAPFDFSGQEQNARGIAFNTDGTRMFILGTEGDDVNEYACTAFDVSTCVYTGDGERFNVSAQDTDPTGLAFSNDGLKLFVIADVAGADSVFEYSLGLAFDISSVPTTESVAGSGGSASKHNTKPSFGLDHKTHFQLIEGGFSFNNVPTDITHNFWTPYDKQSIKVGESNEFKTKVFAAQKLRVQEFLFGIPVVGESHRAELGVEVHYDSSGEIEKVRVIQKTNIIDIDSIQIENIKSKCRADSSDERCVTTQLQMTFLEPLKDSVMAMKAIDFKGRSSITYLNDGFDITGDSLNPMSTMMIPGNEKYEGLIEITQTAKYSDIWVASDGRAFEMNEYGSFKLVNQTIADKEETRINLDRYNSEFTSYKEEQIHKAQKQLEILCEHCNNESYDKINDIFAYEYPTNTKSEDSKIQELLKSENLKAKQILDKIFEHMYPGRIFD